MSRTGILQKKIKCYTFEGLSEKSKIKIRFFVAMFLSSEFEEKKEKNFEFSSDY